MNRMSAVQMASNCKKGETGTYTKSIAGGKQREFQKKSRQAKPRNQPHPLSSRSGLTTGSIAIRTVFIPNRTFLVRFGGISGEFGRAMVRIIPMARQFCNSNSLFTKHKNLHHLKYSSLTPLTLQ